MLSYRHKCDKELVATLYEKLTVLSSGPDAKCPIPVVGRGQWPTFAIKPASLQPGQAKVYQDVECLRDGKDWEQGFVRAVSVALVFVAVMSRQLLEEIGAVEGKDSVLMEYILALEMLGYSGGGVQKILLVVVIEEGSAHDIKELWKSCYSEGANEKAWDKTVDAVDEYMRALGLSQLRRDKMKQQTCKEVVDKILGSATPVYVSKPRQAQIKLNSISESKAERNPWRDNGDVKMVGRRVLSAVVSSISGYLTDASSLETRPHSEEVVEWLRERSLLSYAPILVGCGLDSLHLISKMTKDDVRQICRDHDEVFPFKGGQSTLGNVILISKAVAKLSADPRALPMQERLDGFTDPGAGIFTVLLSTNAVENVLSNTLNPAHRLSWFLCAGALLVCLYFLYMTLTLQPGHVVSKAEGGQPVGPPYQMDYGKLVFAVVSPGPVVMILRAFYIAPRNRPREAKRMFERAWLLLSVTFAIASCTRLMQCYLNDGIGTTCNAGWQVTVCIYVCRRVGWGG